MRGMGVPGGMMAGGYCGPHAYAMMNMGGMPDGMPGRMGMWGQDGTSLADGMQGGEMNQMGGMHGGMGVGMGGGMARMGGGMSPEMAMSIGGMHAGQMGGMQGMHAGQMGGMGGMGVAMGGMQMNGMYQDEMGMRGGYGGQDASTGVMNMGMGMPMGGYGGMAMGGGMGGENGMAAAYMNAGGGAPTARKCPWKLFVGQLPFTAGEEDMMALFGNFGDILECKVLRKTGSQESKGCGFVTFAAAEHAVMAMGALNQQAAIPGHARRLIVHYAK